MKILTVVGARPQFIKHAPVARALAEHRDVDTVLVHTGQHFDDAMSAVFFDELGIPEPDRNLEIHGGTHGSMTGRMTEAVEAVVLEENPDWVLVYGDTNSTLAAALVASKLPTRLAHVEAGLRSFNRLMPEEINRVITDHVSDLCFTPTQAADENLRSEGIVDDRVDRVGDVMFDAVRIFGEVARDRSTIVSMAGAERDGYLLATVHRAESTDDPLRLRSIMDALSTLASDIPVILPLHPRTRLAAETQRVSLDQLTVLPPMGYLDMLALESGARCVVTDSGGVQKEAFFQGRPCVTLREETEWVELVELGWNRLAPPNDAASIVESVRDALDASPGRQMNPYGDGHAADRVVSALLGI